MATFQNTDSTNAHYPPEHNGDCTYIIYADAPTSETVTYTQTYYSNEWITVSEPPEDEDQDQEETPPTNEQTEPQPRITNDPPPKPPHINPKRRLASLIGRLPRPPPRIQNYHDTNKNRPRTSQ